MSVYEKIDKARKKKGVTLKYLNELIGGYRGKLTEVKNKKASLTDNEINLIANALDVSADYLLGNTDDPRPVGEKEKPAQEGELKLLDWDTALSNLTKEQLKIVIDKAMQKFMEADGE